MIQGVFANPFALALSAFLAFIFFVVATLDKKFPTRMKMLGAIHCLVQFVMMSAVIGGSILFIAHFFYSDNLHDVLSPCFRFYTALLLLFLGFFVATFVMGVYFILTNLLFKVHDNEGFSALRVQDYKNFLRLKITENELTVYVVRIKKVATHWREKNANDKTISELVPEIKPIVFEEEIKHVFKNGNWS